MCWYQDGCVVLSCRERRVVQAIDREKGYLREDLRRHFTTEDPLHGEPTPQLLLEEVWLGETLLATHHRVGM